MLNRILYSNNKNIQQTELIKTGGSFDFEFSYTDKKIFSDTIRTVHMETKDIPVYASLKVEASQQGNGVLYSENEYILDTFDSAVFTLPLYPPRRIDFSYGCTDLPQTLIAEQIFYNEQDNSYYSTVKTIYTQPVEGKK